MKNILFSLFTATFLDFLLRFFLESSVFETVVDYVKFVVFNRLELLSLRPFQLDIYQAFVINMLLDGLIVEVPDPDQLGSVFLDCVLPVSKVLISAQDSVFDDGKVAGGCDVVLEEFHGERLDNFVLLLELVFELIFCFFFVDIPDFPKFE